MIEIAAEPYPFQFEPQHAALLIIDMQRDFLEPGGFGAMLGNDVSQLRAPSNRTAGCSPPGAGRDCW
jgi:isochorismate hydrolase